MLSLTVKIAIPNHLVIHRIGHIQRLHYSIPLSSIQMRLDAHSFRLPLYNMLLAEYTH